MQVPLIDLSFSPKKQNKNKQRDYDEEMQVQLLKSDVVQTIRRNKQLEKDLNTMDIKIGLLVKNQIALQEVVAHGHKLRKICLDLCNAIHGVYLLLFFSHDL